MDIDYALFVLQREVSSNMGRKVDLYYYEGYGVLCTFHGRPLHPNNIVYLMPDNFFKLSLTRN